MMLMSFIGGLLLGCFLGVTFMCLLLAGREEKHEEEE